MNGRYKPVGWRYESHKHALAAQGIKTKYDYFSRRHPGAPVGVAFTPKGTPSGPARTRSRIIFGNEEFLERLKFSPEKKAVLISKYRKAGFSELEVVKKVAEEQERLAKYNKEYRALQKDIGILRAEVGSNKVSDASVSIKKLEERARDNLLMAANNPDEIKAANNMLADVENLRPEFKAQRESEKKLFEKEKEAQDRAGVRGRTSVPVGLLSSSQLLTEKEQYPYFDKELNADFPPSLSEAQQKQMVHERKEMLRDELRLHGSVKNIIASGNSNIPKEVLRKFGALRSRSRGATVIPGSLEGTKIKFRKEKEVPQDALLFGVMEGRPLKSKHKWHNVNTKMTGSSFAWTDKKKKATGRAGLVARAAESQTTQLTPHDPLVDIKRLESKYNETKSSLLPRDARRLRNLIRRAKDNVKLTKSSPSYLKPYDEETKQGGHAGLGLSGRKFERNLPREVVSPRIKKKKDKFTPWGESERKAKKVAADAADKYAASVAKHNADAAGAK